MLFHYDEKASEWDQFEWSKRAIHISARKQTKWWHAKSFLHPDIVATYGYIFIWDEDMGLEHFNAEECARFDDGVGGDNEIQRTMLEIMNQLDGFNARGNIKVLMATNCFCFRVCIEPGMYDIRARRKTVTEKDFLDAVNKVIKGYQKFSATPKYMVYN
ncbi:hypothetical protein RJT34_23885 [Clitoria ternatea]|uniref:Uncharacterized protein n=1 Tax=Clitoria ternatea TaxID=43366 RepID=A0AAN9FLX7_CLITE